MPAGAKTKTHIIDRQDVQSRSLLFISNPCVKALFGVPFYHRGPMNKIFSGDLGFIRRVLS